MKNKFIKNIVNIALVLLTSISINVPVSAHTMTSWAEYYNMPYAYQNFFALDATKQHIESTKVYYHFANSATKREYEEHFPCGINAWATLLQGEETILSFNAHVNVTYYNSVCPDEALGRTARASVSGNDYHIERHKLTNEAEIIFCSFYFYNMDLAKQAAAAHEVGHLFGIEDLYEDHSYLPATISLYTGYSENGTQFPTQSDRNAMRIAIENYWFETNSAWKYQTSPGMFYLRGDVDFNNSITSADARLVLRYSVGLENYSALQLILADVDGNGQITSNDSREIERYSVGLIEKFPADEL